MPRNKEITKDIVLFISSISNFKFGEENFERKPFKIGEKNTAANIKVTGFVFISNTNLLFLYSLSYKTRFVLFFTSSKLNPLLNK